MMLSYIALSLAVIFLVLKLTGFLDEFTEAMRGGRDGGVRWLQKLLGPPPEDPDLEKRLDVFKDFFEGQSDEEEDE